MSNFSFLQTEWLAIYDSAKKAESYLNTDARAACWYARMTLEQMVDWLYRYDPHFKCYEASLGARVYDPSFRQHAGETLFSKAQLVIAIGNRAAHARATKPADALTAITELFHIGYWLARTYGTQNRPDPRLQFNRSLIPPATPAVAVSIEQLKKQEAQIKQQFAENQALTLKLESFETIQQELDALRAEIAKAKADNQARQDTHDYNEAQTRDYFIDLLLHEAGWALDKPEDKEFEVAGMPNDTGVGYVDYVLWGDDGKPLAVVEAKRARRDARVGQEQARLYADCLEAKFKRRPVIYYTNGYEHWFWDDLQYPPRRTDGFHKKDELELLIQRRTRRTSLALAPINTGIAGRSYQQEAIRRVTEAIEQHNQRRSLIVMATGAGKTRTVIALVDLLVRCHWAKRVLFLADRVALVKQASNAFVKFAPDLGVVNLLDDADAQGRVYVSTYPTMLNLINTQTGDCRRFGIGYFDVVIVDEAHRSIYAKYRALFDYFDSYLIGLTATPKDEVDRDTYRLFELQKGVPTFAYGLEEAIADGYLVPPKAVSVPLKFLREGIKYKELSEEEQKEWEATDWGDDATPEAVESSALNDWLFNESTVDKMLAHLMTQGEHVAGGDRLGKSIIFAKNQNHAEFIADRFNVNYPHYKGEFARVITFKTAYAQNLINDFSEKDKAPHIAISVDMLDTGIDVPEVVNLVFFKMVRSQTKFWQMIGRGTRLCEDLYAPNTHKAFFSVFDFCDNIGFFSGDIKEGAGRDTDSLNTKLFKNRVALIAELDALNKTNTVAEEQAGYKDVLRTDTANYLHELVTSMTLDNIVVRPKRFYVEKYSKVESWARLSEIEVNELSTELAALPTAITDTDEEAKRFDLMILRIQLGILKGDTGYERLKQAVIDVANALALLVNIPAVARQMVVIEAIVGDEWWEDVTVDMLEQARLKLRALIKLIEKTKRVVVYTDFEDEIGEGVRVDLPLKPVGLDFERFKNKTRDFLLTHEDRIAVQKLRRNLPITLTDLAELEKILLEQAAFDKTLVEQAEHETGGLGLFVRSLVGLERAAAVEAMADFLNDSTATASQLSFVKLIVECLTRNGAMTNDLLYEQPFTNIAPTGPESIFCPAKLKQIDEVIDAIRHRAIA